jgi:hypothetical protein
MAKKKGQKPGNGHNSWENSKRQTAGNLHITTPLSSFLSRQPFPKISEFRKQLRKSPNKQKAMFFQAVKCQLARHRKGN